MTEKRMIEVLEAWNLGYDNEFTSEEFDTAFQMAMKLLKQKPCEDNKEVGA